MAKASQNSSPISILYLLLFAILPLIYVDSVVDNTLIPRQLFSSVILLAVAGLLTRAKTDLKMKLGPVVLLFLGFLLMQVISVTAAINVIESWAIISRYLVGFVFLVLTVFLLQTGQLKVGHLLRGVVIFGCLAAVITLIKLGQLLNAGNFVEDIYSIKANFGHKNLLSSALMLSFPFAVMVAIADKNALWKKSSLALAFLLVIEMFVLRTRGVWLSMFIATTVSLLCFWAVRKHGKVVVNFPWRWVGMGGVLALVILVGLFSTDGFKENIGDRTNLKRRLVFWENSWKMIQDHPVVGVGAGNWRINFPKYGLAPAEGGSEKARLDQSVYQGITHIQRPHNDYLWVWSEAGPLALLCFLGIFTTAIWQIFKNLRHFETKNELARELMCLFGIVAYLCFSITDFPLERTSHTLLVLTLVALPFRRIMPDPALSFKPRNVVMALVVLMLFSGVVCLYRYQGEIHTSEVLEANRSQNARKIVPAAEKAVNAFYNMDHYSNPLPYYSSIGKLFQKNVPGALADAQDAYAIHPYNIIVLNQLGNVYKKMGQMEKALDYYHQAIGISNLFESARLSVAEIYLQQNKPVDALEALALVRRSSRNQKYLQLLSQALPLTVQTYAEHQRFGPLVRYLRQREPSSRQEYVQYFLEFRLTESNG